MEIIFQGRVIKTQGEQTRQKPVVDQQAVNALIEERRAFITDEERERARGAFEEATQEVLEGLATVEDTVQSHRRFIRKGDRVILCDTTMRTQHIEYAVEANMLCPNDAGYISRDHNQPSERKLLVSGGSDSLRIREGNANRPTTVEVLRRIAPGIPIEESPVTE